MHSLGKNVKLKKYVFKKIHYDARDSPADYRCEHARSLDAGDECEELQCPKQSSSFAKGGGSRGSGGGASSGKGDRKGSSKGDSRKGSSGKGLCCNVDDLMVKAAPKKWIVC